MLADRQNPKFAGAHSAPGRRSPVRILDARVLVAVSLIVLLMATASAARQLPRYSAKLANGQRIAGDDLAEWHTAQASPKLNGQSLLDPNNPLAWLRDHTLGPAQPPSAFVEMFSGDCLPGHVIGYRAGDASTGRQQPPHLLVRPTVHLRPQHSLNEMVIRVNLHFVRRIVWHRRSTPTYQPRTAFFRDGRRMEFRAVRFADGYLSLLDQHGTTRVPLADLAEVHLPAADLWQQYIDELSVVCPAGDAPLWQLETTDGLIATSSPHRFSPYTWGSAGEPSRWVHGLQPAWSLDVLWIPFGNIWMRRHFAPDRVPLSRFAPHVAEQRSLLSGGGMPSRINRNVSGGPLHSAGRDFGWGFGVHAFSELRFALPPYARGVRSEFALDQSVGAGGCVRAAVFIEQSERRGLFESSVIVGSSTVVDCGEIALPPGDGPRELILQVDPVAGDRPPGADPFDIRDDANWLDTTLLLDRDPPLHLVAQSAPQQIAAWDQWHRSPIAASQWRHEYRQYADQPGSYFSYLITKDHPLTLSRQVKLTRNDAWLILAASQELSRESRPMIEVRIDGEPVFEQQVPYRDRGRAHVDPLAVRLAPYRRDDAGAIHIEIRQTAEDDVPVAWHVIAITDRLPTATDVLAAAVEVQPLGSEIEGTADWVDRPDGDGERSLRIAPTRRFRLPLDRPLAIRETPAWGECRFVRFTFRKQGGGRVCLELEHNDSREHPARLDAGLGPPSFGMARRVYDRKLPAEPLVITRDLYADFGNLDVNALILSVPDGDAAVFDQLVFARGPDDLQWMAEQSRLAATAETLPAAVQAIADRGAPPCVAIDFGDGRWGTGTIITADGYILTSGHLVLGPDRPATVHLSDGRTIAAVTRGVARGLDLGLLKIEENGSWPALQIESSSQLPPDQTLVGLVHPQPGDGDAEKKSPVARSVQIRRIVRGDLWTDLDIADWTSGGPLVNPSGKLVGIATHESQFGGLIYTHLRDAGAAIDRMKRNEVFGRWRPGTAPMLGAILVTTADGCLVKSVVKDTPARQAGLHPGDKILKVDGHSVQTLDEFVDHLATKMPAQWIELVRSSNGAESLVKIRLENKLP